MQWSELVLGIDGSYNKPSTLEASASDTIARQVTTSSLVNHALTISAQSSLKLIDYATVRARAGYAFGQFLPYAVVGAAVGRFNYTTTATVHDVGTPLAGSTVMPFDTLDTQSSSKNGAITAGFVVALGMDVAITPNVFLRGEWEYVGFAPISGIRTGINTGRVGAGVRF
jgi:opacity protein-like surface antigen